jgi:hypothetical protein
MHIADDGAGVVATVDEQADAMRTDHHVGLGTFKAKVSRGIGDTLLSANIWRD